MTILLFPFKAFYFLSNNALRAVECRIILLIPSVSSFSSIVLSSLNLSINKSICFKSAGLFATNSSLHIRSLILAIRVRSRKESPVNFSISSLSLQVISVIAMQWVSWERKPIISSCSSGESVVTFEKPSSLPSSIQVCTASGVFFLLGLRCSLPRKR